MHKHASLNRVYRLIWNDTLGAWVPASELARGRRKRNGRAALAVAAGLLGMLGQNALAGDLGVLPTELPTGGTVVAGAAAIGAPGAVLNIDQSTQRAAIEWSTFNVGSAAQVSFNQPGSDSATLNRVLDTDPSRIFGAITAPGQVFLTNPNGVYFGESATVDVGGLAATTHGIDTDAFMSGSVTLERNGAAGSVVNDGTLQASLGGYIALLAPEVRNNGVVVARMGTVAMAAGDKIELHFDGRRLAGITTEPSTIAALVENRSAVVAPGGLIVLSAKAADSLQGGIVRNTGTLEATGLAMRDGRIVLEASSTVENTGRIDASGGADGGRGGQVTLTGDRVGLFGASSIDVSGAAGGGDVFVGGGFHGTDPSIANARQVVIGGGATIDASATQTGDGGNVAVWSDGATRFDGTIAARGGAAGGDGGFVEVSGKENLAFRGRVDAGADLGAAGRLLLDPKNIVVAAGGAAATGDVDQFSDTPADDVTIAPDTITAVTNTGTDVTLQANNDITIANAIVSNNTNAGVNGGRGGDLTFQAGRSITVDANIESDDGNVSFVANDAAVAGNRDAGAAAFVNNSLVDAGSGTVSITMGSGALGDSGSVTTGQVTAGTLTIVHDGSTAGAESGQVDLGELNVNTLNITASSDRNVVNTIGDVVVHGTATIDVAAGDVTIDRATTNFGVLGVTARNLTLRDTNAMQFAATNLSGNLVQTTVGPIGSTGAVKVTGTTNLTTNTGGFGYADPYIDLTNAGNDFTGAVTLNVPSNGTTGTGGYATIRDANGITIASSSTTKHLNVQAAGAVTTGTLNAGTSVTVSTSTGNVNLDSTTAGSTVSVTTSNGAVDVNTTAAQFLTVNATGAVDLGPTTLSADLTIATNGTITDSGTITARQAVLTAGSENDIVLDQALNNLNSIRIVSARDATIVDQNALNFGSWDSNQSGYTSHIYRDLHVTTGGDLTQTRYTNQDNYSRIQVDGNAVFTANHASSQIGLYLGASDAFTGDGNWIGQQNNFAGSITLDRSHGNTGWDDVQLRNTNASAAVLTGLTSVGTLNNVYLRFDNAPAVELPGMTAAALSLNAPSVVNTATIPGNKITQAGALVISGNALFRTSTTGDIELTNAGNNFLNYGTILSRNTSVTDVNAVNLYAGGYNFDVHGNLTVVANGAITDTGNRIYVDSATGTAMFTAGSGNDITLDHGDNQWRNVGIVSARNVHMTPRNSMNLLASTISGNLHLDSTHGGTLTQSGTVTASSSGTTTLNDFTSGITLGNADNVFGNLAVHNSSSVTIRENDAITQQSAWTTVTGASIVLTTSNDQAITLDQNNYFGNLTLTQINDGAASAGAVYVRETNDGNFGMTQGSAWTIHGTTRLDSGTTSINLANANNVLGPLQVTGATGTTGGVASTVTIYAKETATTDAITDVGGTGAWNTGNGAVRLIAFDTAGTTQGGGNVILTNAGNVLGDLYVKATDVTITENGNITDGASTSWNSAGDTGWVTTGTTNLIVANPTGKSITLDNLSNRLGALGLNTTGTAGALSSVLITDNTDLTQAAVWNVGTAPVTLDARTHQIALSGFGNVLGNITINTANGTPTAVAITEDDAITQGSAWNMTGVPITLVAQNDRAITLTNTANVLGNLTITGGAVSITENDSITQGGAWTTTGTTTLNTQSAAGVITLTNAANVLGDLAIAGTPTAVSITENADITQASAWIQTSTPFTLASGTHDIVLSQAGNRLGDLRLTGANATVVENDTAGITDSNAWTIPGLTTLTAGSANPIVLNANPASDYGTVSIVSASNVEIADIDDIVFDTSTVAGTLTVTAGGLISQVGVLTAPNLRLIGTGYATLANVGNQVGKLAAGFSGGDLTFVDADSFEVAVIGGTSGVTIGANDVALRSVAGTITGLTTINASSTSLALETGLGLVLPQLAIAGAQTYTAGGTGITLNGSLTSTASGAITFLSPVTLGADLTIQSTSSDVSFAGTVAGAGNQLIVNAGSGLVGFQGAVSALGSAADAAPALNIDSGGATFHSTLGANNGISIGGPVLFSDTVTLANGNVGSLFTGLVTLGRVGGMDLSGYDGLRFAGGVLLQSGPATIDSNDSQLTFEGAGSVSGPFGLTLDAGTQSVIGLDRMGSDLTSLTVTALNPTIAAGGISIAGAQTYTATNGSSITLNGNVTSTAAGAITFNSPVSVGAAAAVTSVDSAIVFAGTVNGNNDLTVNSGTGTTSFDGAVGDIAALGDGTGAALTLSGSGATTFASTLETRSGIVAAGAVAFEDDVALGNGNTGSAFTGLVTSGGADGNTIGGFDGLAFGGGLTLTGGAVEVISNGSTIAFGDTVSGAQDLRLNALAGGAGTVTGLDQIGFASDLTRLDVVAHTLDLPSTGLAVAGPMSFTAAGGITLNGAVGDAATGTGAVDFNGPVTLATGAIAVETDDGDVTFAGTVNGAQALTVDAGNGATTFGAAAGNTVALASVTTDAGGSTEINGGSIRTTGAQTYNDAVTLGANATLTGVGVQFLGTLNGAHTLTVDNSGATVFGGVVGGNTALTSITTDAPGTVVVNTTAVTTTGSQTYNENLTLGANAVFSGAGLAFAGIDGAFGLTANAGSGALQFLGALGGSTPLTSVTATGNTVAAADVTTSGAQSYTAIGGVTLNGDLETTGAAVTITGPVTLGADVAIGTAGGNIVLSGATSTVNGAHELALTAGTGDVVLGGGVGGIAPLAGLAVSGNNLTLPGIATIGDANQSYTALRNITLNQSRTVNAPIAFTADSDGDGDGAFILLNGVSLTASNNTLDIQAADLDLQGNSTLSSGSGLMTITATGARDIALGGSDAAGQMTISGGELARISTSAGLNLETSGAGSIRVNGISSAQSQNITGTLSLTAQGNGDVDFVTAASAFNGVTASAAGGTINVGVNLTTSNDAIDFLTPVSVSGASTIASSGGNITFHDALAVDNDLVLSTANGALTFGDDVGSNRTLTLNLGGGSVTGLNRLQSSLTGLTITSTSGVTLPELIINGPQVYDTGPITVTGNLAAVGITFGDVVDVVSATPITIDARGSTLAFADLASFNAVDMKLIGDEIDIARALTGSGNWELRPYTGSRNVAIGNSTPIVGLNLTAAELAWLPIGTLSSLTIGDRAGTGSLDLAGVLNAPGTPLTLNGGGGITQSGGRVTSGSLTLYAAGNDIALENAANAFGAVAINGTPTALRLRNTLDITQLGAAGWSFGTAAVALNAGAQDIVLANAGNTFGTLELTGRDVQVVEDAATDIGASTIGANLAVTSGGAIHVSGALAVTGNVALDAAGAVTQSAALTVGGNLDVVTSVNAGNVTIDNSGAAATTLGDTRVGGNYVLTATGQSVSQASGATLQVRGDLTVTGDAIVLGGAGNLVGGTTTLPATDTTVVRQSGVITLGDRTETGNLTVISERTDRSFGSGLVAGDAIVLDNAANSIGGRISVTASAPTVTTGGDVQTGITQAAGTSISVAGVASFTAEDSSAGSLGIDLTNAGNSFGVLQLSGTTVSVANAAPGLTTIENALATTSLTLTAVGGLAQTGAITTPVLDVTAAGPITLTLAGNDAGSIELTSGGNAIDYTDANGVVVAGVAAGGADVNLTTGSGNLTQTGALADVGTLRASAGGAVTLTNGGNAIGVLGASTAGTGFDFFDSAGGLDIAGIVRSVAGDVRVRTAGDLVLASGGRLQADAGNVIASTEGAGNFVNDAGASALVTGGGRWLVYTSTPDLVAGPHTVKGGLTSAFRHYGATYSTYLPGAVTESGNGFIYGAAAPTLTVSAAVSGASSHVYGDTPTGALTYTISSGLTDSEDNIANVVTGGTAAYSSALSSAMDAGSYNITYSGGLTSSYTLVADSTGAAYTVTPAELTYVADAATRVYGAVNPALGGTIVGFKLGQDESVLSGSAVWTTAAGAGSNVGQYAVTGSGYSAGGNYTFAQAAGNATALTVTRAGLTVTVNDDAKVYDGAAYGGGNGVTYGAFANGEDASVLGGTLVYGGAAQGARNAGAYAISASGLTTGNYDIAYIDGNLSVARAALTLTANDVTKTYDGTLAAVGGAAVAAGSQLFGTDSLSGGTFGFTDANAGTGHKTVTVAGVTVNDGNGGGNYDVSYVANTTSTINPASIVVSAQNVTKTYDGTLGASGTATVVGGTLFHNASNGGAQDGLSGGTFAFTDKNAGAGNKSVSVSGVTVNDGNGGGNYVVTYADNTTSTIERASLTFAGSIADKQYDGTTAATLAGYSLSGFVGEETVTATIGSAEFADKNAGAGKGVAIGGIMLADGDNGGLASNYVVSSTAAATGNITPKLLTLAAVVDDKVYDGTTNAVLQSYGLSGFVGSETVGGVLTGSATFADKHVGNNKAITITGITLVNGANGGLASNYAVPTSAASAANITPATLQVAGVIAMDKIYDGTTTAYLNTEAAALTGVFGADDVQIGSISGTFASKDAGANRAITAGNVVLSGAAASDYVLVQPTGLSASIAPRALNVSAVGIDKVYDGATAAAVTLADDRIAGDALTVSATGAFLDKNAGANKFVSVTGIALGGQDAGNYVANGTTSTFANVTKANLDVGVAAASKVYDGTTNAAVTLSASPLASDDVQLTFGSAVFADKNAGSGKSVAVGGIVLGGTDAANYQLGTVAAATADITPATLTVGATGVSKVYDGTRAADVALTDDRLAGDELTLGFGSAAFADAAVGTDKPVSVAGIGIVGGADRGNYVLGNDAATATADITPVLADTSSAETSSLPPVLPAPAPIVTAAPPASVLDLTLRGAADESAGGVRAAPGGALGSAAPNGADGVDRVSVSLIRPASPDIDGFVVVLVPTALAGSPEGFTFPLPAALAQAAAGADVRVTLANGEPLPGWLRYVPAARAFVASTPPPGALPIEVLVQTDEQQWTVSIATSAGG